MDNCLFSELAKKWICSKMENPEVEDAIHFEHNPPVKVITDALNVSKCKSSKELVHICTNEKYCVMIIHSDEHKEINTNSGFSQRGSFDERCKVAKIEKLYRINPKWLKASKRKS
jgi:hypothetical protein